MGWRFAMGRAACKRPPPSRGGMPRRARRSADASPKALMWCLSSARSVADDDHADLVEPHADRFGEVVLGEPGDREQLHRLAIVPPVAEAGAGVRARGDVDEHEVVGLGIACNQVDGSFVSGDFHTVASVS